MGLPVVRGDCMDVPRPCPHTTCRYHVDERADHQRRVTDKSFRDRKHYESHDSCVLDVADRGGASQDEVAAIMGYSQNAIRLIEAQALKKFHAAMKLQRIDVEPVGTGSTYSPWELLEERCGDVNERASGSAEDLCSNAA